VVQFPAGAMKGHSSLRYSIQTGSIAHPASKPMGTSVSNSGSETGLSPLLVPRLKKRGAVPPLPHISLWNGA